MRRDVKVDRDLHLGVAHHLAELFLTEHGLTVLRALGRAGLAARDVAPGVAVRRHAPRLAVAAADDIVAGRGALQVGEAADELGRDWHVAPGGRALELVRDDRLIVHPAQRAAHGDIRRSAVEMDAVPLQAEDLLAAQTGVQANHHKRIDACARDGVLQRLHLLTGQRLFFGRFFAAGAQSGARVMPHDARALARFKDLFERADDLILRAARQGAAGAHYLCDVVLGDLQYVPRADNRADVAIDGDSIVGLAAVAEVRRIELVPRLRILPHHGIGCQRLAALDLDQALGDLALQLLRVLGVHGDIDTALVPDLFLEIFLHSKCALHLARPAWA